MAAITRERASITNHMQKKKYLRNTRRQAASVDEIGWSMLQVETLHPDRECNAKIISIYEDIESSA